MSLLLLLLDGCRGLELAPKDMFIWKVILRSSEMMSTSLLLLALFTTRCHGVTWTYSSPFESLKSLNERGALSTRTMSKNSCSIVNDNSLHVDDANDGQGLNIYSGESSFLVELSWKCRRFRCRPQLVLTTWCRVFPTRWPDTANVSATSCDVGFFFSVSYVVSLPNCRHVVVVTSIIFSL